MQINEIITYFINNLFIFITWQILCFIKLFLFVRQNIKMYLKNTLDKCIFQILPEKSIITQKHSINCVLIFVIFIYIIIHITNNYIFALGNMHGPQWYAVLPSNIKGKVHSCTFCPYLTANHHHLIYHLRKHTGERPFQCSICTLKFTTKSSLIRHLRTVHKNLNVE